MNDANAVCVAYFFAMVSDRLWQNSAFRNFFVSQERGKMLIIQIMQTNIVLVALELSDHCSRNGMIETRKIRMGENN